MRMLRSKHYLKKFSELTGDDEPEMKVISSLVKKGDTVLDIGANFGSYTKFLAKQVGEEGTVHSFEPIPEVYGYLKANIQSVDLSNVKLHNCALSDFVGSAQFSIPKFEHSGENFYEGHLTENEGDITVDVKKLDEMTFDQLISFVKCDVEGAELKVLEGAKEFIRKNKPIWMLEINFELETPEAQEIIDFMTTVGYEINFLHEGELITSKPSTHGVNYFFLQKS